MSWGKKSKKKHSVLTNFCFLVNFVRHTGPMVTMVTRYTGGLSQLPVVKKSWGKKSKKKPSVLTNFHFLVNFIRHTGPMVTMVTRYTGSLSQLLVVEMSWGEKSKKKPSVLTNFHFLVNFIRHTAQWGKWGVHMDIVISLRILFNIIFVSASVSHCQSIIGIVLLFASIYRAEYTITSNF